MYRSSPLILWTAGLFALALTLPSVAPAQTAQDLVGTWQITSVVNTAKDGTKVDVFGPNVKGMAIYGPDGRVVYLVTRAVLPKFASDNRMQGTPDENKAIVQGSHGFFGTYSVADKVLIWQIEAGTWPAWTGAAQKRQITSFSKDEMTIQNVGAAIGGSNVITLKRLK